MDDFGWLELACDLARLCPPSRTAFSVGAIIVSADGRELARAHSREHDPNDHAEEAALAKLHPNLPPTNGWPSAKTTHPTLSSPTGTRTPGAGTTGSDLSGPPGAETTSPDLSDPTGAKTTHPTPSGATGAGTPGPDLSGATVYSSLEPCGRRASRPHPCAELIVASGVRRVVFAWREPALFAEGTGAEILAAAGVELVELPAMADRAREPNAHLL
ncbi:MAG: hypothetical protein ACRDNL_27430 [Spirillospora sp.]